MSYPEVEMIWKDATTSFKEMIEALETLKQGKHAFVNAFEAEEFLFQLTDAWFDRETAVIVREAIEVWMEHEAPDGKWNTNES